MYLKHGQSNLPEYKCWQQIKQRCLNPEHEAYPDYGGRGITLDPTWVDDFEAFFAYIGSRPSPKHSLDRKDNDLGYIQGNVRWATSVEQNNNRRPHRIIPRKNPLVNSDRVTNFKHGMIRTPEYHAWIAMKDRCLNPNSANYQHWGGRGVTVYAPWVSDFMVFYAYVGPKPTPYHSLDRYPNRDGNYEPGNVRWASKREQNLNRRETITGPSHGNYDHGGTGSPTYKTWQSIKVRCFNTRHDRYPDYGGRGTTMCRRWRDSFDAFREDVGIKPEDRILGRLDHDGHYSCGKCDDCKAHGWPANCAWLTRTEANRRRRPSSQSGKLDESRVATIRERLEGGSSDTAVAVEFGVARSLIGKIRRGEVWIGAGVSNPA